MTQVLMGPMVVILFIGRGVMEMHDERAIGYLSFWGKTRRLECGNLTWHPLAYHSLDVAAVGALLLRDHNVPAISSDWHPLGEGF